MAHFACYCHAVLRNSICPSDNVIYLFSEKQIFKEIKDPKAEDFYEFCYDREAYYWQCTDCGRIFIFFPYEHIAAKCFCPYKDIPENIYNIDKKSLDRIFIFKEEFIDSINEQVDYLSVKDFYEHIKNAPEAYISKDRSLIVLFGKSKFF